jgi:hypothetical protein
MSRFLINLAARARGTLPRLEPRRPAPFEIQSNRPEPFNADMPAPAAFTEFSASAPRTLEAALSALSPDSVRPTAMPAAAPHGNPTPAAPAPIISAAAAPAAPARRRVAAPSATGDSGPAAQPPASPVYTSASAPMFATASEHAGTPSAPAIFAPAPAVLAALAHAASASRNTVSLPAAPHGPTPVISTDADREVMPNVAGGSMQAAAEAPDTRLAASQQALAQSHATHSPLATLQSAPAPLVPQVAAARERTAHVSSEANAPHRAEPQQAPTVEIHIGTIELVAQAPQIPQPAHAPAPGRGISLDDFLDGVNKQ